eukprot:scaffold12977_cov119-Isochrysis_galbana.AAC.5
MFFVPYVPDSGGLEALGHIRSGMDGEGGCCVEALKRGLYSSRPAPRRPRPCADPAQGHLRKRAECLGDPETRLVPRHPDPGPPAPTCAENEYKKSLETGKAYLTLASWDIRIRQLYLKDTTLHLTLD